MKFSAQDTYSIRSLNFTGCSARVTCSTNNKLQDKFSWVTGVFPRLHRFLVFSRSGALRACMFSCALPRLLVFPRKAPVDACSGTQTFPSSNIFISCAGCGNCEMFGRLVEARIIFCKGRRERTVIFQFTFMDRL